MLPTSCTVTIRDFLTDKHGFTLPASRLSSYDATLKHTSSSLFRHPKAFSIHFHASVNENDCETPLEKDRWERGEYFKEAQVTLWAHFVRVSGVDLFGMSPEERELQQLDVQKRKRRRPHECRTKEVSGVSKRVERKKNAASLEQSGFPPPHSSHDDCFSRYTEIVSLPENKAQGNTMPSETAHSSPGPRPTLLKDIPGGVCAGRQSGFGRCDDRVASESPLFEQEVMIKREISPLNWDDDAVIEWDDEVCC